MALENCTINTGYTFPCRTNNGGVKAIYLGVYSEFETHTMLSNQIIAFFLPSFYFTITQRLEQAAFNQNFIGSIENGTTLWEQSVSIVIEQVDATISNWINILGQGLWRIIVLDNNGFYWLIGKKNGAYMTAGQGGPNKVYGDGNKTTITFVTKEPLQATKVSTDAALSVILNQ